MGYNITTGFMPYKGFKTFYRIVGDINESYENGLAPLVLLHGGPGSTHNYFELLDSMAESKRAIVMYDQLGCGESYVSGHNELWIAQTWIDELVELRKYLGLREIHLLGQSWGGMLAITYLCDFNPIGVKSVILSSTLSDSQLWGKEQHRQIKFMDLRDQKAIEHAEQSNNYTEKAYLEAVDNFMERHCAGKIGPNTPECIARKKQSGTESYLVAWGPNEFTPQGTLANWNYTDKLHEINCPVLIISGTNDLCTPLIAKTMFDKISNAKWELFADCRHMCFVEETEKYLNLLKKWFKHVENV